MSPIDVDTKFLESFRTAFTLNRHFEKSLIECFVALGYFFHCNCSKTLHNYVVLFLVLSQFITACLFILLYFILSILLILTNNVCCDTNDQH